jgi:hypothetical protein
MLEGIQILIDRMEMFPDDFREGGALHDFVYILDGSNNFGATEHYKQILTEEEIAAFKEATLKFHRENLNRAVIEAVMEGQDKYNPHKFAEKLAGSMKNTTQAMQNHLKNNLFTNTTSNSGLYGEVVVGGAGGGGTGVIGGGAFTTKTGALFTPANIPTKKKK